MSTSNGPTSFVRVYQGGKCTKTVRGEPGQKLISTFWKDQLPSQVIKRSYPERICKHDENGNEVAGKVQLMFPKTEDKYLYLYKGRYYTGLIYLVDVFQEFGRYTIKGIYVAQYKHGLLMSIARLKLDKFVWFNGNLGFVDLQPHHISKYICKVYSSNECTEIPIGSMKHIACDKDWRS